MKRTRRVAALALGLGLGLFAAEAGARLHARIEGAPWSAREATRRIGELRAVLFQGGWNAPAEDAGAAPDPVAKALHPYLGFETYGALAGFAERAAATREAEPGSVFELAIVGGSVSAIVGHRSGERIARALEADPRLAGRTVRVHVLGQGGLKQPQQAQLVQWAFAIGWRLDAVVNVDGFNELAMGVADAVESGAHPLYPTQSVWAHVAMSRSSSPRAQAKLAATLSARDDTARQCDLALGSGALRSAVAGMILERRIERGLRRVVALVDDYAAEVRLAGRADRALLGPEHSRDPDACIATIVAAWEESSLSIAAMCERRGIRYLHVLQPALHDEGSKPLTEREIRLGVAGENWITAVRTGYPRLREAGRALVARDVDFLDASRLFETDSRELYYDCVHVNADGSDAIADAIAHRLLSRSP